MSDHYLNTDETISKTSIFNENKSSSVLSPFHIAYGIDKNFVFGCGISITSILLHNKEMEFVFHVFIDDIADEDRQRFAQLADLYNTCIQIHTVNCDRLRAFPTTKNWSVAMYFRFVIGDYFIGREEKILYLDADIVCQGSLQDFIATPLDDNVAAVVAERDENWWKIRAQSLACPSLEKGYFNSGVLLLNIDTWKTQRVSEKAMAMLSQDEITRKLTYMDQDILNIILVDKVKFVEGKYNTQFSINYELKNSFFCPINDNTVLIHYVGPTKPWHAWANYASTAPFRQAKKSSPWRDISLMKPTNANYARYCAKHNFKQHKPMQGIANYIYYFYLKITK